MLNRIGGLSVGWKLGLGLSGGDSYGLAGERRELGKGAGRGAVRIRYGAMRDYLIEDSGTIMHFS